MDRSDDPHALSEQLEHEADELEDRSHELDASVPPDDQPTAG